MLSQIGHEPISFCVPIDSAYLGGVPASRRPSSLGMQPFRAAVCYAVGQLAARVGTNPGSPTGLVEEPLRRIRCTTNLPYCLPFIVDARFQPAYGKTTIRASIKFKLQKNGGLLDPPQSVYLRLSILRSELHLNMGIQVSTQRVIRANPGVVIA
jgi:hypothetical protein